MNDVLFLAWRYLVFNRWKTAILVAAITVIVFLPLALELVLERSSDRPGPRGGHTAAAGRARRSAGTGTERPAFSTATRRHR